MYSFEDYLSKDISHQNTFKQNIANKHDIIILGNSLTREGIKKDLLEKKLIESDELNEKNIGYLYPDDVSIPEWYYIVKYLLNNNENNPNEIYINFASNQLISRKLEFEEIQRISSWVSFSELSDVIKNEQLTLSQIIDLYFSKVFKVYRYRERIAKRVLNIVPNYRSTIRKLNKTIFTQRDYNDTHASNIHLNELVHLADSQNVTITFCAMPLPYMYQTQKETLSIINDSHLSRLANFQDDNTFTENDFSDGYHLNTIGARKLTNRFSNLMISQSVEYD